MMTRVGGAFLIGLASLLASSDIIDREKRRIECVDGFLLLVSHIKEQIEGYSTPIRAILEKCDPRVLKMMGIDGQVPDIGQMITSSETMLTEDSLKALREFSSTLGKSYREVQLRECNKAIAVLEGQKAMLKAAYPSKRKTVIALGAAVGGMAVILLV